MVLIVRTTVNTMISKLVLKDFKTHKNTVLEFSSGINIISGDTGHGKTNILLALQMVKDNRPLGNGYIRRGQDTTTVITEVVDGRDVHGIVRRRGQSENSYDIEKDGVSVVGEKPFTGFGSSPPGDVSEILNLSDINIQKQRDKHFLVYSPPGQIATYIRSITKLDEIDQVTKLLSGKIRVKKATILHHQAELKSTVEKLAILSNIDLELLEDMIEEAKDKIQKIAGIREKIGRIEPITSALRTLEENWITIPDDVDKIFEEIDSRQESIVTASSRLCSLTSIVDRIKEIENNKITLPADVDKILANVNSTQESVIELTARLFTYTSLINEIKKIDASRITLPEDFEILSTVEDASEKYTAGRKKMETVLALLKDIGAVESEIRDNNVQLKQLRCEEKQLMEELNNCPNCGTKLTETSKAVLLGE